MDLRVEQLVTDELVGLPRAVCSRPVFVGAIEHALVLQDMAIREPFRWRPDWVSRITAPTLLPWTDHDPTAAVGEPELLLKWLPDARLIVIEDVGHWTQWVQRAEFPRVHVDFPPDSAAADDAAADATSAPQGEDPS